MAKKRKHDVTVNNAGEALKKQQLVPPTQENPPKEEEFEYEEVEEEVEEDDDEEEDDDSEDDDDEAEPILQLLEPFTKDILATLLNEAARKHRDVAKRIREVADEDPVHRKIFVHGLGWDTTTETLLNAFRQYGEIEDCKAVTDKNTGKSKGYGFILFKSRTGARNALKEPQKKIGSRMTACQLAAVGPGPSNQAAPQSQSVPSQPASEYTQRKIYVSNVSADIDPKKLTEFFARYGEIEEGPLGLDKMTGKPKGFCLFVYRSVESSRKALEEPHKNFEGHMLHCQRAIDGPKHGKNQHQNQNTNQNAQSSQFQSSSSFGGGAVAQFGQGATGMGYSQGQVQAAAAMPALNPVLGQALTALLTAPGAGLGQLTNLLGTLGSAAAINQGAGHGLQAAYGSQLNASSGVIGGYGTQGGYSGGQQQQLGQGASARGQQSGQYPGSGPYLGQ